MFVETLISAVLLGMVVGGYVTYLVAVDPLRRSRNVLRDRLIAEQMRTYAAESRFTAYRMLRESTDHDRHSRKVTPLRSAS